MSFAENEAGLVGKISAFGKKTRSSQAKPVGRFASCAQFLENNPHDPKLRTHALSGDLAGCWACSAGYDLRIIFEFSRPSKTAATEIHLLNLGTHDEVY